MIKAKNINALYLATVPFMAIYLLPNGLALNWILALMIPIFNLSHLSRMSFIRKRKNEIRWFLAIMAIGGIGALYNSYYDYFDTTLYLHNLFTIVIFFLPLITITDNCNVDAFKRILYVCGTAASLICIFQRAQLLLTGHFEANVFIPGLILSRDLETFTINRVSAFFTEPAHLAIYLLPIFNMALYDKKSLISLLIAAGIIFSGSTTGFLLTIAILLLYLISKGTAKKYIFLVISASVFLFCVINIYFPDVFLSNIEKLNDADSGDSRLLGTLSYIQYMDIGQLTFGIGLNELTEFLRTKGIILINDYGLVVNANYANAVIFSFISYGLFGFMSCLIYFYHTIKDNKSNLGFVVFAIGILSSDQVLFNRNLLYLTVILIFSQKLIAPSPNID